MTFDTELARELERVGIRGARARRIAAELADHRSCDPDAVLGEPREIAERFATELRLPLTRRAAWSGLGALALTAALLCVTVVASSSRPIDLFRTRGTIAALGGLTIVIAAQLAFVAGVLALLPLALRGAPDLVQRRLGIGLAAGVAVAVGEAVQAAALAPFLDNRLLILSVAAFALPLVATAGAARTLVAARAITPPREPRGAWPREIVAGAALLATAAMTLGSALAEHSWTEGVSRGAIEACAIAACYSAFARRLGLRS